MKHPVTGGMRVRSYEVLTRAVEDGVNCGWRRAHKHTDMPGEEAIKEAIYNAVTNAICEYFSFEELDS